MDKILWAFNQAIFHERLKFLELIQEAIAANESGQTNAADSLWDMKMIVEEEMVEVAEKLGLVISTRWTTKDGVSEWMPNHQTQ